MGRITCSILSSFLLACTTVHKVPKDHSLAPVDASQARLETTACGHFAIGNNACWIDSEETIDSQSLDIHTYHSGVVNIVSTACGIEVVKSYRGSQTLSFPLRDLLLDNFPGVCVIDILMQPEFPDQRAHTVPVRAIYGQVVLVKQKANLGRFYAHNMLTYYKNDQLFFPGTALVSVSQLDVTNPLNVLVLDKKSCCGEIMIAGCGRPPVGATFGNAEMLAIHLHELIGVLPEPQWCSFYGQIVYDDGTPNDAILILLEVHDDQAVDLAEPVVEQRGEWLFIESTEPVAWTIVDKEHFNQNTVKIKRDSLKRPVLIRQITAQGRTRVVKFDKGQIVWSR